MIYGMDFLYEKERWNKYPESCESRHSSLILVNLERDKSRIKNTNKMHINK